MKKNSDELLLWNCAAKAYAASQDDSEFSKLNKDIVCSRFPCFHGESVLDLGCGPGWYTEYFRSHGAHTIGCDGSEAMITEARNAYPL